jgi:hypothetical protein
VMKDNFECLFPLFYCFENCDGEPFCFDTTQTVAAPSASSAKDWGGGEDIHTTESPSS